MKKRILSLLLVFAFIVGLIPATLATPVAEEAAELSNRPSLC